MTDERGPKGRPQEVGNTPENTADVNLPAQYNNALARIRELEAEVERLNLGNAKDSEWWEKVVTTLGLHPHSGPEDAILAINRLRQERDEAQEEQRREAGASAAVDAMVETIEDENDAYCQRIEQLEGALRDARMYLASNPDADREEYITMVGLWFETVRALLNDKTEGDDA